MNLTNNVNLIGNLGADPEVKNADKGKEMCTFSLASHYFKKNEGGVKEKQTEWHNLVAFNGAAVLISQYVKKGSKIAVNGSLRTRHYVDKKGETKYTTEVVVDTVLFLDTKKEENA